MGVARKSGLLDSLRRVGRGGESLTPAVTSNNIDSNGFYHPFLHSGVQGGRWRAARFVGHFD